MYLAAHDEKAASIVWLRTFAPHGTKSVLLVQGLEAKHLKKPPTQ
jgi:hypothetical protein